MFGQVFLKSLEYESTWRAVLEVLVGPEVINFEWRPKTAAKKASSASHSFSHSFENIDHKKLSAWSCI